MTDDGHHGGLKYVTLETCCLLDFYKMKGKNHEVTVHLETVTLNKFLGGGKHELVEKTPG